jgi:hypothetical protein
MEKNIKRRNELLTKIIKNDNVSILTEEELNELYDLSDGVEHDKGMDFTIIDIRFEVYNLYIELYGVEEIGNDEIITKIAPNSNVRYYDAGYEEINDKDIFLSYLEDLSLEEIENELDEILISDYNNNFKGEFRSTFPENYDENEDTYIEYLKAYATAIEYEVLDNMVEEHFQDEKEINEDEYKDFQEEVDELYNRLKIAESRIYSF